MRKRSWEYIGNIGITERTCDIPAGVSLRSLHESVKQSSIFSCRRTCKSFLVRVLLQLQAGGPTSISRDSDIIGVERMNPTDHRGALLPTRLFSSGQ